MFAWNLEDLRDLYIPVSLTIDEFTVQRAIKIGHLSCDPLTCMFSFRNKLLYCVLLNFYIYLFSNNKDTNLI